ncbi:MAG: large conductance mechanosensitive channel protein MscL [Verrucomicrobiales bacterium]|nr:large conductance mechanosensitive channel protein MscL [Verrucomicrobiales bacterium]
MIDEFKSFALKGNMVDLAIGVIIGGAFGGVVNSLVKDVIMAPIGALVKVDFSKLIIPLSDAGKELLAQEGAGKVIASGEPYFGYGNFLTVLINFMILAFVLFMVVKAFNKAKAKIAKAEAAAPTVPSAEVVLLTEIRDLLKKS